MCVVYACPREILDRNSETHDRQRTGIERAIHPFFFNFFFTRVVDIKIIVLLRILHRPIVQNINTRAIILLEPLTTLPNDE